MASKEFTEQFEKEKALAKAGKAIDTDMQEDADEEDVGDEEVQYEEKKQGEKSKFARADELDEDDDGDMELADEVPADLNDVKTAV